MSKNFLKEERCVTILAIGFAKWFGCDPRALAQAFRGMSHTLIEIDAEDYVPWRWNGFTTRVFRRLFLKALVNDYNRDVLQQAKSSEFDFILVFKGMYLKAETLRILRSFGKPVYNIYPDVSFTDHGSFIPSALLYYDCVFTTKSFHGIKEIQGFNIREMIHVRHGFDPEVHRPVRLSPAQMERYGCDVSFVGCWSPEKEQLISGILEHRKKLKIIVYGIGWKYASPEFKKTLANNLRPGVFGDELAIVYNASKVNLGLLSKATGDPTMSDQTTVRTFQIPASGSFMLHEDTSEVQSYFQPEKEIMLFSDEADLLLKLDVALNDDILRETIKTNGHRRCLSEPYDYTSAAEKIIKKLESGVN
jgi:hypothetical protein